MPGQDNEGIGMWVFGGGSVPGITPCFDLEPTVYLGPKDGEAIPDEGAIYSECIDFQGQISGSGRILARSVPAVSNVFVRLLLRSLVVRALLEHLVLLLLRIFRLA